MQLATVHLPAALFPGLVARQDASWQLRSEILLVRLVMAALSVLLLKKRLVRSAWLAIAFMAATWPREFSNRILGWNCCGAAVPQQGRQASLDGQCFGAETGSRSEGLSFM